MSFVSLLLTLLPIIIILCLLIVWKQPANVGIIGWLAISLIALFAFQTSIEVILRSTAAGFIRSFSVSLIVAMSLLQMAYMEKTGALRRIIIFIKTIACENRAVQIMMINIGFGTLMVAVGATPSIFVAAYPGGHGPLDLRGDCAAGHRLRRAYTYALLGAPIVVFVDAVANGFLGKGNEIHAVTGGDGVLHVPSHRCR